MHNCAVSLRVPLVTNRDIANITSERITHKPDLILLRESSRSTRLVLFGKMGVNEIPLSNPLVYLNTDSERKGRIIPYLVRANRRVWDSNGEKTVRFRGEDPSGAATSLARSSWWPLYWSPPRSW